MFIHTITFHFPKSALMAGENLGLVSGWTSYILEYTGLGCWNSLMIHLICTFMKAWETSQTSWTEQKRIHRGIQIIHLDSLDQKAPKIMLKSPYLGFSLWLADISKFRSYFLTYTGKALGEMWKNEKVTGCYSGIQICQSEPKNEAMRLFGRKYLSLIWGTFHSIK